MSVPINFNVISFTAITCPSLLDIKNGTLSYNRDVNDSNYLFNTSVTYSCNEGFFLNVNGAEEVRTCQDDEDNDAEGMWSGEAPTCVRELHKSFYFTCICKSQVSHALHYLITLMV